MTALSLAVEMNKIEIVDKLLLHPNIDIQCKDIFNLKSFIKFKSIFFL